jgi:hypothetical protein
MVRGIILSTLLILLLVTKLSQVHILHQFYLLEAFVELCGHQAEAGANYRGQRHDWKLPNGDPGPTEERLETISSILWCVYLAVATLM